MTDHTSAHEQQTTPPHPASVSPLPLEKQVGSDDAKSSLYKRGEDHILVVIPAPGLRARLTGLLLLYCFLLIWDGLFIFLTFGLEREYGHSLVTLTPTLAIVLTIPHSLIGIYKFITAWESTIVTIDPKRFRIERTLKSMKNQVNPELLLEGRMKHTIIDWIFCRRLEGWTCRLLKAETRILETLNHPRRSITYRCFALWEGVQRHALPDDLEEAEEDWIANEINRVIYYVGQPVVAP